MIVPLALSVHSVVETMISILRGCIKKGELSERVFELTRRIIMLNTSFITAWYVFGVPFIIG